MPLDLVAKKDATGPGYHYWHGVAVLREGKVKSYGEAWRVDGDLSSAFCVSPEFDRGVVVARYRHTDWHDVLTSSVEWLGEPQVW